jgi:hypothetical protein
MDKNHVETWLAGYQRAWNSNDPQEIGALFSAGAAYYTGPFDQPWVGREAIVSGWLERKDEPGSFNFRYQILCAGEDQGVVRGWTQYFNPDREYSNIWVIQFDEQGLCKEFTEWWMRRKQPASG